MRQYPVFLRLLDKRCVVVGGGRVASAKAAPLRAAGARVVAVSPDFAPEFRALEGVERHVRPFAPDDLNGAFLAVAAADDPAVNRAVAQACLERGVLCNVTDAPELCDFYVPSMVDRGPVAVAVSTGGHAPALAKRLRREIEALLPEDYGAYAAFLGEARRRVRERVPERAERERIAAELASRHGYERFAQVGPAEREAWLQELVDGADRGDSGE